jgi:hypothetical protein
VPAHAISLLSWLRDEIPWRKFACSLLAFGVMTFPLAIFVFAIYVLKTGAPPTFGSLPSNLTPFSSSVLTFLASMDEIF